MVNIYLFTKNSKVLSLFNKIKKSRTFSLSIFNPKHYKKILSDTRENTFTYLDISSFTVPEKRKLLNYVTRQNKFDYGIIDPESWIKDPAELFFKGASDYLPKSAMSRELTIKRIKEAVSFYPDEVENMEANLEPVREPSNWESIIEGESYTFTFLLIEIDMIKDWILNSGKHHLNDVMTHFYNHIKEIFTPLHGKIWMQTKFGALILFPFSGSAASIIIECFRMQLNRVVISAEKYPYKTILSYKMALDIGTTIYMEKGNTGTIISNSVNYIFHLGTQYAKKGTFYLTNRVYEDVPPGILDFFTLSGNFQEKTVYRMLHPLY